MAIDTKLHLKIFPFEPVHCFYCTMALAAIDFLFDMPLVVEEDMFRDIVDFNPRCRGLRIKINVFFLNLRMRFNNMFMTVKAFFHRRYAGESGAVYIGMTESALNLLYSGMNPMAESNGLFRPYVCRRRKIKIKQE